MTMKEYQRAVDGFAPDAGMKDRIAAAVTEGRRPVRRPAARVLAGALAAAALLVCTMGVAMAASPDFRAAVLAFFHIETAERVPGPTGGRPEEPEMTQNIIGAQVKAQYIRLPDAVSGFSYGDGVLFQALRGEDGTLLDVNYWAAEGDGLLGLETHVTAFSAAWDGVDYAGSVYWCAYDGHISCYGNGSGGMAVDWDWAVSPIPGRTDAVLLKLSRGSQMDYRLYPMLLDLESGGVTDLLAGTGWEKAAPLREAEWNSDLSAAILRSDRTGLFYCDCVGGTAVSLDELTGLEVYSAWFAPDGALILLTDSGEDCRDAWTYNPAAGTLERTFSGLPVYRDREDGSYGFRSFYGGGRGIYVAQDGAVTVLDLTDGSTAVVEGFSLEGWENVTFINSPDGGRILFAAYDGTVGGLGVSALGVMDLAAGQFTLLDRENYEALYEGSLGWFDALRVAVTAHAKEQYNETYLYLYEF